jgi:hypothetical protein
LDFQTSPSFDCMFSSMCLHLTHWLWWASTFRYVPMMMNV